MLASTIADMLREYRKANEASGAKTSSAESKSPGSFTDQVQSSLCEFLDQQKQPISDEVYKRGEAVSKRVLDALDQLLNENAEASSRLCKLVTDDMGIDEPSSAQERKTHRHAELLAIILDNCTGSLADNVVDRIKNLASDKEPGLGEHVAERGSSQNEPSQRDQGVDQQAGNGDTASSQSSQTMSGHEAEESSMKEDVGEPIKEKQSPNHRNAQFAQTPADHASSSAIPMKSDVFESRTSIVRPRANAKSMSPPLHPVYASFSSVVSAAAARATTSGISSSPISPKRGNFEATKGGFKGGIRVKAHIRDAWDIPGAERSWGDQK